MMRAPRSFLPALLTFAVALVANAGPSDPECAAPKGRRWLTGKLVKVRVEERAEGGPGSVIPPREEGAAPAPQGEDYGQILDLTVTERGRTWAARCAVGVPGCDPAGLDATVSVPFMVVGVVGKTGETGTLILKRRDGRLLCARVAGR
jgi:hypothetical protein